MSKTLILLAASAILLSGCSSGPSVEGKWTISGLKGLPPSSKFASTFSKPDKMTMTVDMDQAMPTGGGTVKIHADIDGTYVVAADTIELKITDTKVKIVDAPAAVKPMLESGVKTMGDQMKAELNKGGKQKIKWEGNDSFVMSGANGESATYTRVK